MPVYKGKFLSFTFYNPNSHKYWKKLLMPAFLFELILLEYVYIHLFSLIFLKRWSIGICWTC